MPPEHPQSQNGPGRRPGLGADVIVLGAGVIGLSVAWRAAQAGLSVTLLDRAEPGAGTTRVAAGMLAPISEADPAEPELLELMDRSARLYPRYLEELREVSGLDPGHLSVDTLVVARDGDEAEALTREQALRTELGLGDQVRRLTPSAARELEPSLAPTIRSALLISGEGAVDPRRLTAALVGACAAAGVTLRTGFTAVAVEAGEDDGVQVVAAEGERLEAEHMVLATGPWAAAEVSLPAGLEVPVTPVKGQTLRLRDPAGPGLITRVLRMPGGYLVPRGDGGYVLGATMEEQGFDTTPTAGAVHELLHEALRLVPGLSELVIEELAVGLRPATPDHWPLLGPTAVPGLHLATGHFRHGVLLAPVSAELVVAGLLRDPVVSPGGAPA